MTKTGLKRLVDETIVPILAGAGFKSRDLVWNRIRGRFIDVLDVQTGKGGRTGHEHFTINVGVFVPDFHEAIWGKKHRGLARAAAGTVDVRIGEIHHGIYTSNSKDKWWQLDGDMDYLLCRKQVSHDLIDSALPFLERFQTMRDVVEFLSNQGGWRGRFPLTRLHLALALREIGDIDGCRSILEAQSQGQGDGWSAHAKRLLSMLPASSEAKSQ